MLSAGFRKWYIYKDHGFGLLVSGICFGGNLVVCCSCMILLIWLGMCEDMYICMLHRGRFHEILSERSDKG
jgi:hypothetical protein